jgi:hypothetical protein
MIVLGRVISGLLKTLAWVWLGLLLIGLFGKLYLCIRHDGFFAGFGEWRDWFGAGNPVNIAIHVVEVLPAVVLLYVAGWLDKLLIPSAVKSG